MNGMLSDVGIILVDHGSQFEEANDMLHEMACLYAETTGARAVEPAHMELAPPTIADAFARCVACGVSLVVVQPYFLSPGRHSSTDIPRLAAQAAAAHPGVDYVVTEPLGIDRRLCGVLYRRVCQRLRAAGEPPADVATRGEGEPHRDIQPPPQPGPGGVAPTPGA